MKYPFSTAAALVCLLIGWNPEIRAQPVPSGNPMLAQLAEMSGGVRAGIEFCDIDESAGPAKSQQQNQFVQMGGTPAQFETGYQTGYDRAKSQYEAATAGDRQNMCDQLRTMLSAQ